MVEKVYSSLRVLHPKCKIPQFLQLLKDRKTMTQTKTTSSTGRGRPGYSREQVIAKAVDEFNAHGYEATSMGTLAKSLGITKSAIYHHVTSKEQILEEATNLALSSLEEIASESLEQSGGPKSRLLYLIKGSITVLCKYKAQVTLLLRLRGNSEVELEAMKRRRTLTHTMIDLVTGAQQAGEIRADLDPRVVGRLIFGTVNSLTDWYEEGGSLTPEEISNITAELVLSGLKATPTST